MTKIINSGVIKMNKIEQGMEADVSNLLRRMVDRRPGLKKAIKKAEILDNVIRLIATKKGDYDQVIALISSSLQEVIDEEGVGQHKDGQRDHAPRRL